MSGSERGFGVMGRRPFLREAEKRKRGGETASFDCHGCVVSAALRRTDAVGSAQPPPLNLSSAHKNLNDLAHKHFVIILCGVVCLVERCVNKAFGRKILPV